MSTPQKIRCTLSNIIDHGGRVYTLELTPERAAPRFKAGQFLHLALDAYDPSGFWPESRVFSIASSPEMRDRLLITYSVKGSYTTRMEKELTLGKEVWIKLPYGEFIIEASQPVSLIAGGTGMTAFTAFLDGLAEESAYPISVFYGAREKDLLIFRDLLEKKSEKLKNLTVFYFIENLQQPGLNEVNGLLSANTIWSKITDPLQCEYYLSGPPPMLQKLTSDLQAKGLAPQKIHIDAWE